MGFKRSMLLVLISLCIVHVTCKSDDNATTDDITGQDLIDMGRKFNKPFLRLIGQALQDVECRTKACSPWTEWSGCEIFVGQFGMKERSRICGDNSCKPDSRDRNETETKICQVVCPSGYDLAKEGFCFKLYNTSGNRNAAHAICRNDDGYLVNVNSHRKWTAAVALLQKSGHSASAFYMDGHRKDNKSPWTYNYEGDIIGYTNWAPNEPDNGSNELCLAGNPLRGVYDVSCSDKYYSLCEIVPSL